MANRPVNTGSGGAAAPPSRSAAPPAPAAPAGHRAARTTRTAPAARADRTAKTDGDRGTSALAWLPYLIVLAGVAAGLFVAWKGSMYAGRGAGLIGASLLAGAVARLILPARYAGLLSSRRKASDVLALALLGAAVLAVAIALP
jgi:Protein of unknown function (DUF3017)